MIIDCISDLHGFYPKLEGGDLLIVAGDLTGRDTLLQHSDILEWINKAKYTKKIIIAGNHDNFLQSNPNFYSKTSIEYLCDSGTEFEFFDERLPEQDEGFLPSGKRKLKIWGTPWTKTFEGMNPHCKAFTFDTEQELEEKWRLIPTDIDILITHEPPYGIKDLVDKFTGKGIKQCHVGSHSLLYYTRMHYPKLHVFGHIHESYGKANEEGFPIYVNASHVNEHYQPVNKPVRIEL